MTHAMCMPSDEIVLASFEAEDIHSHHVYMWTAADSSFRPHLEFLFIITASDIIFEMFLY